MADQKLTQLTETTDISGTEILYVVEDPGGSPVSRKVTAENLVKDIGNATYAPLQVVASTATTVTKTNSVAEETLLTLPTPTGLVAGDVLSLRVGMEIDNTSGSAVTYTFLAKLGATTFGSTQAISAASAAASNFRRITWDIEILLDTLSAQRMDGIGIIGGPSAFSFSHGTTTSFGALSGVASEDLSTSKNLVITCQMGTSSASASISLKKATLKRLKKAA